MAAKRKITLKKKDKVVETPIEEVEKAVETVVEEEINVAPVMTSKNVTGSVMGTIGNSTVVKPKGRIKFEAQVSPMPLFMLPEDIRKYLIRNGLTSDVYKKDKEWLEKHNVDMEMVEKLKNFLTERL